MTRESILITRARQAEKSGDIEQAVTLFSQAGELSEAARILVAHGDFGRAGRLLFRAAGVAIDRLKDASAEQRRLATKAAICLAKAGETQHAVTLFVAVGDLSRAIETLERAGDAVGAAKLRAQLQSGVDPRSSRGGQLLSSTYIRARQLEQQGDLGAALAAYVQSRAFADAGRVARSMGKLGDAGGLYEEGGHYFEAAVCWHEAKEERRCLDTLVRVARDEPRYRTACMKAIALSVKLGELSFEFDQFISRFVAQGPDTAEEANALYALGLLYMRRGFPENAMECFRKVLGRYPEHAAAGQLATLEREARGSAMVFERIVREEAAFRGDLPEAGRGSVPFVRAELAELPELPPLPGGGAGLAHTRIGLGASPGAGSSAQAEPGGSGHVSGGRTPAPAGVAPPQRTEAGTQAAAFGDGRGSGLSASPSAGPAHSGVQGAGEAASQAAASGALDLRPGAMIADRYRLEHQIGQGGTASVFRATDLELEEDVAIKVFTVAVDDPDLIRRFKQELSVTRRLSHPNIVRLHDIGIHQGFRFLTMEILQGRDLAALIAQQPPSMTQAIDYLVQACRGLDLAHQNGIVHRDIKPENFFVTSQGVLKVMDFGIAKKAEAQKRTQAGFIAGTPPYMSPEQINGFADVTHLADIYSLGIVAYEMLTGALPFMHEELMPLLLMHINEPPRPPKQLNASIPDPLNALVLNLLEKSPQRRIQSMATLADMLTRIRPLVEVAEAAG